MLQVVEIGFVVIDWKMMSPNHFSTLFHLNKMGIFNPRSPPEQQLCCYSKAVCVDVNRSDPKGQSVSGCWSEPGWVRASWMMSDAVGSGS